MEQAGRAAHGGVGTALFALTLVAIALSAGWASGSLYGTAAPPQCSPLPCESDVLATAATPAPTPEARPQPHLIADVPTPATKDPVDLPPISAQAFALIEGACGALINGRNHHERIPPASLTKLMTAAIATDRGEMDMMITSNVDGMQMYEESGSTIMGLVPGMELSLRDLLYGLMLPSGNDAAIAIAEGISGSEAAFVTAMNAKAQSLALRDTHFTNPHGLFEEGLHSSAYDMGMLARYVMQNADLREIVATVSWQPAWDGDPVWNGNALLGDYEGADGVKIGFTEESLQTIVASASKDGRRVIASIIRSEDRYTDAWWLLDWAFQQPSACP
jgi:serine-type D-Ala-D-Ala carboxypeptidase (penicillin-binding protein 5/6)